MQLYGGDRLKVHDAVRPISREALAAAGEAVTVRIQTALRDVLLASLQKSWSLQKLSQLMKAYVALGEIKKLVDFASNELFHEMGLMPEITAFLEAATVQDSLPAADRFWGLDGLVFAQLQHDRDADIGPRLETMATLIADHDLGADEKLALGMKRMIVAARQDREDDVQSAMNEMTRILPNNPGHQRIARYNYANALFLLGRFERAIEEAEPVLREYFEVLGITPEDIIMKNEDKIRPLLPKGRDNADDLKHVADCMDLLAKSCNRLGRDAGLLRIQAMKFYLMAHAYESHFRLGQDLVDEFVGRRDYEGARSAFEQNLLPSLSQLKLLSRVIPLRSQYAVILAYCGDFAAADYEMAQLAPYELGLSDEGRVEFLRQRQLVEFIRANPPPPQWQPSIPRRKDRPHRSAKVRVNAPCPCGSGKKFKKCCGRR